ncbi:hypothetical protein RCH14_004572, partial [Massilia sp. MP_M2]
GLTGCMLELFDRKVEFSQSFGVGFNRHLHKYPEVELWDCRQET